jgi:hypothetical protein
MKNFLKSDFKTPFDEIKAKSYHLHWIGGRIVAIIFFLLFFWLTNGWPLGDLIGISLGLNFAFWFTKEMVWGLFEYLTRDGKCPGLKKLSNLKVFGITPLAWSEPDWKDLRFSVYGSIPGTLFIYFAINKQKQVV